MVHKCAKLFIALLWAQTILITPSPLGQVYPTQVASPFITAIQPSWAIPSATLSVTTASELDSKLLIGFTGLSLIGTTLLIQKSLGTSAALLFTGLCSTGIGAAYGIWRLMIDNDIETVLSRRFASAYKGPLPRTPEFMELLPLWRQATGFFDWLLQRRTTLENCMFIKLIIAQSSNGASIAQQFHCCVSAHDFTFIPKMYHEKSFFKTCTDWFFSGTTYLSEQHHKRKTLEHLMYLLSLVCLNEQLFNNVRFIKANSSFETNVSNQSNERITNQITIQQGQDHIKIETKERERIITLYPPLSISCFNKSMVNDLLRASGLYPIDPISIIER